MLSVRMRASQMRGKKGEVHISGAEGLFGEGELQRVARSYLRRAMSHSRGQPDRVVLTVERITARPRGIAALPVATLSSGSPREASILIKDVLASLGITSRAIRRAIGIITSGDVLRGASLMDAATGRRLEPDQIRGVRASRIGISPEAARELGRRLCRRGINAPAVKEALVLASKVASCRAVVAELCVSDDPDYTTGYVASRGLGYLRIPNIKKRGSSRGGRVFFLAPGARVEKTIVFLEETPVMITSASSCKGMCALDEIIGPDHR